MPITRNDVSKKLTFASNNEMVKDLFGSKGSKSPSKGPPLTSKTAGLGITGTSGANNKSAKQGGSAGSSNSRPKRNATIVRSKDVVNLERLTTDEFMNTLGEGPSTKAISANKEVLLRRKKEEALRFDTLTNLNGNILNADRIDISSHDDLIDEELGNQSNQDLLDDTLPVTNNDDAAMDFNTNNDGAAKEINSNEKIPDISNGKDSVQEQSGEQTDNVNGKINTTTAETGSTIGDADPCSKCTQTPKIHYLCTCQKCQSCVAQFIQILQTGSSELCEHKTLESLEKNQSLTTRQTLNLSNVSDAEEQFVPLYKGAKVKVSLTAKAKLKSIHSSNIQDYVNTIMESLYTEVQMANMSAKGRTKGSHGMSKDNRDGIEVYLSNKFENVEERHVTEAINNKCYAVRRKLWSEGNNPEVRKPFPKKERKPSSTGDEQLQKSGKETSKKSETRSKAKEDQAGNGTSKRKSSSKIFIKAGQSKTSRPTTGGKCPKPFKDLIRDNSFQSMDGDFDIPKEPSATSTPSNKSKNFYRGSPFKLKRCNKDSPFKSKHNKVSPFKTKHSNKQSPLKIKRFNKDSPLKTKLKVSSRIVSKYPDSNIVVKRKKSEDEDHRRVSQKYQRSSEEEDEDYGRASRKTKIWSSEEEDENYRRSHKKLRSTEVDLYEDYDEELEDNESENSSRFVKKRTVIVSDSD